MNKPDDYYYIIFILLGLISFFISQKYVFFLAQKRSDSSEQAPIIIKNECPKKEGYIPFYKNSKTYYEVYNYKQLKTTKEIIILIHGFTTSSIIYHLLINKLMKLNSSKVIIIYDLFGHGNSTGDFNLFFTYKNSNNLYIDQLRSLIEHFKLNLKYLTLIGHSVGGDIAISYAATLYNENVKFIQNIICIGSIPKSLPFFTKCLPLLQFIIVNKLKNRYYKKRQEFLLYYQKNLISKKKLNHLFTIFDFIIQKFSKKKKKKVKMICQGIVNIDHKLAKNDLYKLKESNHNILFIHGENDQTSDIDYINYLCQKTNNQLLRIKNGTHLLIFEMPDGIAEIITQVVNKKNFFSKDKVYSQTVENMYKYF